MLVIEVPKSVASRLDKTEEQLQEKGESSQNLVPFST